MTKRSTGIGSGWITRAAVMVVAVTSGVALAPTPAGAAPTGFVIAQTTVRVPANGAAFPDLSCPTGKTALSGGFERTANLVIAESRPLSSQWHVAAWNPTATDGSVTVFAVCANVEFNGRPSSTADVVVEPNSLGAVTATCPVGFRVSGGGFLLDDFPQHAGPPADLLQGVTPYWSEPELSVQGWTVKVQNTTKTARLVRAFAICTSAPSNRTVSAVATLTPGQSVELNPACSAGEAASGGGWAYEGTAVRLEQSSRPRDTAESPLVPHSWSGTFSNARTVNIVKVRVTALCTPTK
jgi:hypothetical protein